MNVLTCITYCFRHHLCPVLRHQQVAHEEHRFLHTYRTAWQGAARVTEAQMAPPAATAPENLQLQPDKGNKHRVTIPCKWSFVAVKCAVHFM